MTDILNELESWFAERPRWLQDAARRIIQNGQVSPDDIKQLVELCKAEAGIYDLGTDPPKPSGIVPGSLQETSGSSILRLHSISDLKGINALAPRKALEFGDHRLTVIYGQNASGKSGYVRAIKHGCGQRNAGTLLDNVFSNGNEDQSCKFKYSIDGVGGQSEWTFSGKPVDELRPIQVYDSGCGTSYVTAENEVAFEPFVLSLFTKLSQVCEQVDRKLEEEIRSKVQRKPEVPPNFISTPSELWYGNLSHLTIDGEISERCNWTEELETELGNLSQRLVEANPSEKAKNLRVQKNRVESLRTDLAQWNDKFSDKNCHIFITAMLDVAAKRRAADTDAARVFADAPLDGVASESWKLLWKQARAFSEELAYKAVPFPNTGPDARCVLCQQPLGEEAKERLISFESFVRGNLESQASLAEARVRELYLTFSGIGPAENLDLRMDSLGLVLEADRQRVVSYCTALETRKSTLLKAEQVSQLPVQPSDSTLQFLAEKASAMEAEAVALDKDAKGEDRPLLEGRRSELITRRWLFQQRTSVQREVDRLKQIQKIKEAQRLASTQALSGKKSKLTDTLITEAYVKRFHEELVDLGAGQIKVRLIKTRAERGHVFHRIQLDNPKKSIATAEVLSEGEFRMVSLAAFLADVEARQNGAPFIFDDPISSLDHIFEEATARRLVELCKTRQVIVFTHRLSLVEYIENAAERAAIDSRQIVTLRREDWGPGEPGEPSINHMEPVAALNGLSEKLREAKRALEQVGRSAYEDLVKGISGDFRNILECTIERKLLDGVIRRYTREVHTKNKLKNLAKINAADCIFFDDLMTKYSKYEHSQPSETPVKIPEPDEIGADLQAVKEWIAAFKKRPIPNV